MPARLLIHSAPYMLRLSFSNATTHIHIDQSSKLDSYPTLPLSKLRSRKSMPANFLIKDDDVSVESYSLQPRSMPGSPARAQRTPRALRSDRTKWKEAIVEDGSAVAISAIALIPDLDLGTSPLNSTIVTLSTPRTRKSMPAQLASTLPENLVFPSQQKPCASAPGSAQKTSKPKASRTARKVTCQWTAAEANEGEDVIKAAMKGLELVVETTVIETIVVETTIAEATGAEADAPTEAPPLADSLLLPRVGGAFEPTIEGSIDSETRPSFFMSPVRAQMFAQLATFETSARVSTSTTPVHLQKSNLKTSSRIELVDDRTEVEPEVPYVGAEINAAVIEEVTIKTECVIDSTLFEPEATVAVPDEVVLETQFEVPVEANEAIPKFADQLIHETVDVKDESISYDNVPEIMPPKSTVTVAGMDAQTPVSTISIKTFGSIRVKTPIISVKQSTRKSYASAQIFADAALVDQVEEEIVAPAAESSAEVDEAPTETAAIECESLDVPLFTSPARIYSNRVTPSKTRQETRDLTIAEIMLESETEAAEPSIDSVASPALIASTSKATETPSRRRVMFVENLSPEVFDRSLPPNSPLKKGATPRKEASTKQGLLKKQSNLNTEIMMDSLFKQEEAQSLVEKAEVVVDDSRLVIDVINNVEEPVLEGLEEPLNVEIAIEIDITDPAVTKSEAPDVANSTEVPSIVLVLPTSNTGEPAAKTPRIGTTSRRASTRLSTPRKAIKCFIEEDEVIDFETVAKHLKEAKEEDLKAGILTEVEKGAPVLKEGELFQSKSLKPKSKSTIKRHRVKDHSRVLHRHSKTDPVEETMASPCPTKFSATADIVFARRTLIPNAESASEFTGILHVVTDSIHAEDSEDERLNSLPVEVVAENIVVAAVAEPGVELDEVIEKVVETDGAVSNFSNTNERSDEAESAYSENKEEPEAAAKEEVKVEQAEVAKAESGAVEETEFSFDAPIHANPVFAVIKNAQGVKESTDSTKASDHFTEAAVEVLQSPVKKSANMLKSKAQAPSTRGRKSEAVHEMDEELPSVAAETKEEETEVADPTPAFGGRSKKHSISLTLPRSTRSGRMKVIKEVVAVEALEEEEETDSIALKFKAHLKEEAADTLANPPARNRRKAVHESAEKAVIGDLRDSGAPAKSAKRGRANPEAPIKLTRSAKNAKIQLTVGGVFEALLEPEAECVKSVKATRRGRTDPIHEEPEAVEPEQSRPRTRRNQKEGVEEKAHVKPVSAKTRGRSTRKPETEEAKKESSAVAVKTRKGRKRDEFLQEEVAELEEAVEAPVQTRKRVKTEVPVVEAVHEETRSLRNRK